MHPLTKSFKTTGMIRIIQVIMAGNEVGGMFLWFYYIMGFVHLNSGLLLACGATKVIIELILESSLNVVCFSKKPN